MKTFKKALCVLGLGVLAIGAGAVALSHTNKAQQAKADVNVVGEFIFSKMRSKNVFGNMNEMIFLYVSGTDYPQPNGEHAAETYNVDISDDIFQDVGFWDHVRMGNQTVNPAFIGGQIQLNRFTEWPCFSIMPSDNGVYDKMTITQGALIPTYSYLMGGAASYYSLKYDFVFTVDNSAHVHDGSFVDWTLDVDMPESVIAGEFSITEISTIRVYSGDPDNKNEMLMVKTKGTDYPDVDGEACDQQYIADAKFPLISSYLVMGSNVVPDMLSGQYKLNHWQRHPVFTCCPLGIFDYNSLTLKKGLLIPSYTYIKGGAESYYRLVTTYTATRVDHVADANVINTWTFTGEPYLLGQLRGRPSAGGCTRGQHPDWDGNRIHIIFGLNESDGWEWDNVQPDPYNNDGSALVDDGYTENILFDGKTLKQLNAEGKIYRLFKANSIGKPQFGVVFNSEDYDPAIIELKAGTKIPAPDGIGYYLTKIHILKYDGICGFFDAGRDGGLDDFVKNYMHFADVSTSEEGTGECVSEGWYTAAKTAFNNLEGYEKACLTLFDTYNDAEARLAAWATANGDVLNGWSLEPASLSQFIAKSISENNIAILISSVSFALIATSLFLVIRKRKVER